MGVAVGPHDREPRDLHGLAVVADHRPAFELHRDGSSRETVARHDVAVSDRLYGGRVRQRAHRVVPMQAVQAG